MDARKYDAIQYVAPGQFDTAQRRRLEAFTAARALIPNRTTDEMLDVAQFIING